MGNTWSEEIGFGSQGGYVFPDEDGVYVIAKIIDGIHNVRYVGSGNLHDRVNDHLSSTEPNNCLKDVMSNTHNVKIKSVVISNDANRSNVEYTCYKHYLGNGHNLCNKIDPPGQFISDMPVPF